jgi:hypothetical protein
VAMAVGRDGLTSSHGSGNAGSHADDAPARPKLPIFLTLPMQGKGTAPLCLGSWYI